MSGKNLPDSSKSPIDIGQLGHTHSHHGKAVETDPISSSIRGLSYSIVASSNPLHKGEKTFTLQIKGWRYGVDHASTDFAVLSFDFCLPFKARKNSASFMSNIKVNARGLKVTERSAHRSFMAALFIIKQIEKGQVPETSRVLRLYKIHPSQHSLYDQNEKRAFRSKIDRNTLLNNVIND